MGIGSLIGGVAQGAGTAAAAATQASAANTASADQMSMYNQTRASLSPFISGGGGTFGGLNMLAPQMTGNLGAGNNALASLLGFGPAGSAGELAALQNTPGYQFTQQQGNQALDRTAAAKGLLLSGGQLKDAMAYNQGLAQQTYGNTVNQMQSYQNMQFPELYNLASLGENAAAGAGSLGMQAANTAGQMTMAGAGAVANGINNLGSITGNTINNAMQSYQMGNSSSSANAPNTGAAYMDANGNWVPGAQGF